MTKPSSAQIVATVGPSSGTVAILSKMIASQMDVARLNFSHGTHQAHAEYIHNIRAAAKKAGRRIPIIQDLSGPRIQKKSGHRIAQKFKSIITPKDLQDLRFGIKQGLEYIAMSYVGAASDVHQLRTLMKKLGALRPIIAKIERKSAVKNLSSIIKAADAIMIGRGDLANEVPLEEIPFIEKKIIASCKSAHKSVITATQMMLSMVENPSPTRAEVTDVAFAIVNGSDCVMLSEETAIGKYPVETVKMMEKIVSAAEKHLAPHLPFYHL
jgi:pyruvate kinase